MRRLLIPLCIVLALASGLTASASAEEPTTEEQLVYALEVFDGAGYVSTFAPMSEGTIYLLADQDNSLSPRYTMVYYWPLTQSYRTDWNALNEPADAKSLEVLSGSHIVQTLSPTVFSVVMPEGYGSRESTLSWGSDAEEAYLDYQEQRREYSLQMQKYRAAFEEYERLHAEYTDAMLDQTITEKPAPPVRPEEPIAPVLVVTPPTRGFKVDFPVGTYRIRLKDHDDHIIFGSEKTLVSFSHRRTGIGYNIIPESQWTEAERSDDPQETIYVDGLSNAALYLQPFLEAEFNEAYYLGLLNPQDHSGGEDRWIWAHLEAYDQGSMALLDPKENEIFTGLEEKAYSVIQISGPRLGYQVIEFQPETMSGQRPTFYGFKLGLQDGEGRLIIRLIGSGGESVAGSEREVRWILQGTPVMPYVLICTPLLVGVMIFLGRRARLKRLSTMVQAEEREVGDR